MEGVRGGSRKNVAFLSNSFLINKKRHKVTIYVELNPTNASHSYLCWEQDGKFKHHGRKQVCLTDIITAQTTDQSLSVETKNNENSEELPLHLSTSFQIYYAEKHKRKNTKDYNKQNWIIKSIKLSHSQVAVVQQWILALHGIIQEQARPRQLLVFINPYGGKRKALNLYETKVEPLFKLAGVDTHVLVTKYANHAVDFLQDVDINKFDGLVSVGGDGTYCEVLSGLLLRTQKENNVDIRDIDSTLVKPTIGIGIIPAGSTDAISFCTTGTSDPVTSTLFIILGSKMNVDICTLHSNGESNSLPERRFIRFSTCMASYGYFGDTLVESERYRWMGPLRYDWSGFKNFMLGRTYEGTLKLKRDIPLLNHHDPKIEAKCTVGCERCDDAGKQINIKRNKSDVDFTENPIYPPGFNDKFDWDIVTGKFWAINSATMTCECRRAKRGLSPSAHLGDGHTDVVVVRKTSKLNYLRYLMRTAYRADSPFNLDSVDVFRVKTFQFKPHGIIHNNVITKTSSWNCDGEIVTEPGVVVSVHCQLVTLFARGICEDEPEPSCCVKFCKKKKTVPSDVYTSASSAS